MKEAKAELNDYRQSPRKVRRVADIIRGKKIDQAQNLLDFAGKRSAGPIAKLLNSAISNAKDGGIKPENLFVKSVSVDQGKILYRRMPVAHGAAHPIRKRTSHIKIVLGEKAEKIKEKTK